MKPDDLIAHSPSAEELSHRAEVLRPSAELEAELRKKLEASRSTQAGSAFPPFLEAAREKLDVRYADAPTSERPLVGQALILAKRAFRLVGQPFINEALRKQVEFNQLILSAVAQVYEHLQQQARSEALFREEVRARLRELNEKKR